MAERAYISIPLYVYYYRIHFEHSIIIYDAAKREGESRRVSILLRAGSRMRMLNEGKAGGRQNENGELAEGLIVVSI